MTDSFLFLIFSLSLYTSFYFSLLSFLLSLFISEKYALYLSSCKLLLSMLWLFPSLCSVYVSLLLSSSMSLCYCPALAIQSLLLLYYQSLLHCLSFYCR